LRIFRETRETVRLSLSYSRRMSETTSVFSA